MAVSPQLELASQDVFPDEGFAEGAVVEGGTLTRDLDEAFDYVVVGSGAAGSVAAHTLAAAGHAVAIVEEGPWIKTRDFTVGVAQVFNNAIRDNGMQVTQGRNFIPVLQGRCVGGSTLINSAIAWRTPADVLADWRERFGLSITEEDLAPHFDALEADLSVRPVADEALGENNRLFLEQCEKRGYAANRMRRYDAGCKGSGRCLQGCPSAAKRGMSVTYVPWALRLGARIFASCRAERVSIRGGRAVGLVARAASGRQVSLRARYGVFVAASTIQSPNLLHRSGIRGKALGQHFQTHPGVGMGGLFDRPIGMSFGATQGAECTHFRKTERFKLETISMPPELAAARMTGVGLALEDRLAKLGNVAVWVAQIRAHAQGSVTPGWFGRDSIRYSLGEDDVRIVRKALVTLAELLFDAGAREVWPGVHGLPTKLTGHDDVRLLREGPLDPRAYSFVATHLFGAARMGPSPADSVVDPGFCVHGTERLWVVDSSVFPTNLGVNPQHSIMAMSRFCASKVAEQTRGFAAA